MVRCVFLFVCVFAVFVILFVRVFAITLLCCVKKLWCLFAYMCCCFCGCFCLCVSSVRVLPFCFVMFNA